MKNIKIVFTDAQAVRAGGISLDKFSNLGNVEIHDFTPYDILTKRISGAYAVICNKTTFDRNILSNAPDLKYIGLLATGYNNIDIECAEKNGITVCNAASYSTAAVAQQVFGYILNRASCISQYDTAVKNGDWENSKSFCSISFNTTELMGKTIGIIGYGSIGTQVARLARAFDMNVLVCTKTKRSLDVNYTSFENLLKNSDYITVHCPLTKDTENMFDEKAFSMCKHGSYFINTSRGAVVCEQALKEALEKGILSGAAVDVLREEPMSADCVLKNAPNITITPHVAWASVETRLRLLDIVYDNLRSFLNGNPKNIVKVK